MADWTNLPNAAVGVGGLPSGTTVTALRDNPIAIAEGALGAPRLSGRPILAAPQSRLVAGDNTFQSRTGEVSGQSGFPGSLVMGWRAMPGGQVRVSFGLRSSDGESTARGRIVVNGSIIIEEATTSDTFVTFVNDVSINFGDLLEVYAFSLAARMNNCLFRVNASVAVPFPFPTYAPSNGTFNFGIVL